MSETLPFVVAPALPHVREFQEADAAEVARLWSESGPGWPGGVPGGEHRTAARVVQEQRDLNTLATLIAFAPDPDTDAERAVGYCSLMENTHEAETAYISLLNAHPGWHGRGIGRDLLFAALARTVELGYRRLTLNTWAGNLKAVPLYKKTGYFWAPQTSVLMENYLPLIFQLPPAQAFFRTANWYRDFDRALELHPDEEHLGRAEVYTYRWRHGGHTLKVVIDRRSHGVVALETDQYAVSLGLDEPRLPVGGRREARWMVENRRSAGQPLAVSVLAEGEDAVRCAVSVSGSVAVQHTWTAPVTAEQPGGQAPANRPGNRVRSTVIVGGEAVPLMASTQVVQPVEVSVEPSRLWLAPGVRRPVWLHLDNTLDEPVQGTLRLTASPGLALATTSQSPAADAPQEANSAAGAVEPVAFAVEPHRRLSWPVQLEAGHEGSYQLRAQAVVTGGVTPAGAAGTAGAAGESGAAVTNGTASVSQVDAVIAGGAAPAGAAGAAGAVELKGVGGRDLVTKVFGWPVHVGEPGALFVEHNDERVLVLTDRLACRFSLAPTGDWAPRFSVSERESGRGILSHSVALGPPFIPSIFTESRWTPSVEQQGARVRVVLSASPSALPGVTFERAVEISPSGLLRVQYAVTNAGRQTRQLQVNAATSVSLDAEGGTQIAVPLATGLVVDSSSRFPDWREPELIQPERYAESWMAEFGDGWVGATIWREASAVEAGWSAPDLTLELGKIAPGARAETVALYLYAGQGDWHTARHLWRQLVAPHAREDDPTPRPAHRARLERFVFATPEATVVVRAESERGRPHSGALRLDVAGQMAGETPLDDLRAGTTTTMAATIPLAAYAQAVPATVVLDLAHTEERHDAALFRVGSDAPVQIAAERRGNLEVVRLTTARLRLAAIPSQVARVQALETRDASGEWVNHLYGPAPEDAPGIFVWFNPWYGGLHPGLYLGNDRYPGALAHGSFTWQASGRTGKQGVRWQGITLQSDVQGRPDSTLDLGAGLHFQVSYLTTGESNVLAVPFTVENRGRARLEGRVRLHSFVQPGGDRGRSLLHYERTGASGATEVFTQRRVQEGMWGGGGRWVAVSGPDAAPVVTLVPGTANGFVSDIRDMGPEGAHPAIGFPLHLSPGERFEGVTYVVLAEGVEQARLYRFLSEVEGLA